MAPLGSIHRACVEVQQQWHMDYERHCLNILDRVNMLHLAETKNKSKELEAFVKAITQDDYARGMGNLRSGKWKTTTLYVSKQGDRDTLEKPSYLVLNSSRYKEIADIFSLR